MSATPYFKCYTSDFLSGIMGLTFEEIGAFVTLVLLQYDRKRPVPADLDMLAWRGRVRPSKAKKLVERLIETGKLVLDGDSWSNPRASSELSSYRLSAEISSRNGREGAEKQRAARSKNNDLNTLEPRQTHAESRSQKPEARISANADRPAAPNPDLAKEFERRVFEAHPEFAAQVASRPAMLDLSAVNGWLQTGADLELDILPAVLGKLTRQPKLKAFGWRVFEEAIAEHRQKRLASPLAAITPPPAPKSRLDADGRLVPTPGGLTLVRRYIGFEGSGHWLTCEPDELDFAQSWRMFLDQWRKDGTWNREDLGPAPGEPHCVVPERWLNPQQPTAPVERKPRKPIDWDDLPDVFGSAH